MAQAEGRFKTGDKQPRRAWLGHGGVRAAGQANSGTRTAGRLTEVGTP
jgi:hypothetical protein